MNKVITALRKIESVRTELQELLKDGSKDVDCSELLNTLSTSVDELSEATDALDKLNDKLVKSQNQSEIEKGELSTKSLELEKKNEALEQWATATAHDLKEPIRVMALYSELLRENCGGSLDHDGETYLDFITNASSKALSLIQDLMSFHTVGGRVEAFKSMSLSVPLIEAIETLKAALTECGGKISYGKMPTVTADGAQMVQVFSNVIGNSLKFRSDRAPVIRVDAKKEDGFWLVSIVDNGIGFGMEYAERVFQLFERLSADEYDGNGIGLALCRKIVENHGGKIWADSDATGTKITFTIPI